MAKLTRKQLLKGGAIGAAAAAVLPLGASLAAASDRAQHARWDIIRLTFPGGVLTLNAGGFADAKAPDNTTIRLTGAGALVDPAGSNGYSGAVTGGGTWRTFSAGGAPTGSGTYSVAQLVTFELANFQTGALGDTIGDTNERANGTAVLRIAYSDGTQGVLTVGCHGPGAPPGIFEGIAVTKAFKTYDRVQPPGADPDANRTVFHVRR